MAVCKPCQESRHRMCEGGDCTCPRIHQGNYSGNPELKVKDLAVPTKCSECPSTDIDVRIADGKVSAAKCADCKAMLLGFFLGGR